jgi:hypothetical protein
MVKVQRTEDGVESKRFVDTAECPDYIREHPELRLKVDRRHVLKGLESTLGPDIKWHIPDSKRYFLRAQRLLAQQTPTARRAQRMMGFKEDKSRRWANLPPIPQAHKRRQNNQRPVSDEEKKRRVEMFSKFAIKPGITA